MGEYRAARMMSDKAGGLIRLGTLDGGIEYVELESDRLSFCIRLQRASTSPVRNAGLSSLPSMSCLYAPSRI